MNSKITMAQSITSRCYADGDEMIKDKINIMLVESKRAECYENYVFMKYYVASAVDDCL